MTRQQIVLVKKSWLIFSKIDANLVGNVFYSRLYTDAPHLKRLFKSSVEERSQKLMDMLSAVIHHLDAINEITDDIQALASRHIKYGVKPKHYEAVENALLWTMQQGLGTDWSEELAHAWQECYRTLASIMITSSHPSDKVVE
jgi:nitric oxide dioxygenase